MSAPVIHIGMPKTATTTIQRRLIEGNDLLYNVGKMRNLRVDTESVITGKDIYNLIWSDDKKLVKSIIEKLSMLNDQAVTLGRTLVLSDERLAYVNVPLLLHKQLAHRLAEALPFARVLITIRNQWDIIPSIYLQSDRMMYAALGWPREVPKKWLKKRLPFHEWIDTLIKNYHQSIMSSLEYDNLYMKYANAFGVSNIHVIPAEDILSHRSVLSDLLNVNGHTITNALQINDNVARKKLSTYYGGWKAQRAIDEDGWLRANYPRFVWKFFEDVMFALLQKMPRIGTTYSAEQKKVLVCMYEHQNMALSTRLGLNLKQLGYSFSDRNCGDITTVH